MLEVPGTVMLERLRKKAARHFSRRCNRERTQGTRARIWTKSDLVRLRKVKEKIYSTGQGRPVVIRGTALRGGQRARFCRLSQC